MCWALIMTVESRLTRWIAERNKSTQPYQSRARRQSPTTKRSVLHVGLSWWVLYSNNKDREEYQQHGVSSYIRLSGAAMYSVIVIARAAEFIVPPWSAVKRRECVAVKPPTYRRIQQTTRTPHLIPLSQLCGGVLPSIRSRWNLRI